MKNWLTGANQPETKGKGGKVRHLLHSPLLPLPLPHFPFYTIPNWTQFPPGNESKDMGGGGMGGIQGEGDGGARA
jgi:hypothetical protein